MINYIVSKEIINYYRLNYCNNEQLDNQSVKEIILNDLSRATTIKFCGDKVFLKNDKLIYLLSKQGKIKNLINIYNTNVAFKEKEVFLNNHTGINVPPYLLNIIFGDIFTNLETVIKRRFSKRLIKVKNFLCYCTIDETNTKVRYNILKMWTLEDISNNDFEEIKDYFCLNDNELDLLIDKLGLIDKVYKEKEQLCPEELIYQKVLDNELSKFPIRFWSDDITGFHYETAKICTKYLFEKVLKWDKKEICIHLNSQTFINNKLGGMLGIVFNGNIFYALDNAYPNKFKPFELINYDSSWYWSLHHNGLEHAYKAKEYLIQKLNDDDIIVNYDNLLSYDWYTILGRYHLSGIITATYNNDLYSFFKDYFGKEFTIGEIETYKYKFKIRVPEGFINPYK